MNEPRASHRRRAPGIARLAGWTLGTTVLLVSWGAFTRGSGSGYGCQDSWPLCENGLLGGLLPRPEFHMVVEWTHRWLASIAVVLVAATLVVAWWRYREETRLKASSAGALVAILAQAGLGAVVVMSDLNADLVSVHLGVAMVLVGVLAYLTVQSHFVGGRRPVGADRPDRRWRTLTSLGAGGVLTVIVLGSLVHDRFVGPSAFPDGWPLVGGQLVPSTSSMTVQLHYAHRVAVAVVFLYLTYLAAQAIHRHRPRPEIRLVHGSLALFLVNIGLGAAHVFTQVQSVGLVVAHLLTATLAWAGLVAAVTLSRRADASAEDHRPTPRPDEPVHAGVGR